MNVTIGKELMTRVTGMDERKRVRKGDIIIIIKIASSICVF